MLGDKDISELWNLHRRLSDSTIRELIIFLVDERSRRHNSEHGDIPAACRDFNIDLVTIAAEIAKAGKP